MNTVHGKEPYSSLFFAQYPGKVTPVTQVFVSKQHGKQSTLVLSSIMFLYFESFQATVPTALPHQPKAVWKRVTSKDIEEEKDEKNYIFFLSFIHSSFYVFSTFCLCFVLSCEHAAQDFRVRLPAGHYYFT